MSEPFRFVDFRREEAASDNGASTIEPSVPVGNTFTVKLFHDLQAGFRLHNNMRLRAGRQAYAVRAVGAATGRIGATSAEHVWEVWSHYARIAGYDAAAISASRPRWEVGSLTPTLPDPEEVEPTHAEVVKEFLRTWECSQIDSRPTATGELHDGYWWLPFRRSDGTIEHRSFAFGLTPFAEFTFRLSTFPSRYGLGKTIGAITLLPGEEQDISLRTWQSAKAAEASSSNMLDSFGEESKQAFQSAIEQENQTTISGEEKLNWNVQAEVSASFFGMASAKVEGGASGESKNAVASATRAVSKAVGEHAAQSNRNRKLEVTTRKDLTTEEGSETTSTRRIKNINLRRVLNFVFRELNQVYETIMHLAEIRVGLRSNLPDDFVIVDLKDGNGLFLPSRPDMLLMEGWTYSLEKPAALQERIMHNVVRDLGTMFDEADELITVLEEIGPPRWKPVAHDVAFFQQLPLADGNTEVFDLVSHGRFWRFRRNVNPAGATVAERDAINQEGRPIKVAGLIVSRDEVILKTQSVVTEALLGSQNALDDFATSMQEEAIRAQKLSNDKVATGIAAVEASGDKAAAYSVVFTAPCRSEVGGDPS